MLTQFFNQIPSSQYIPNLISSSHRLRILIVTMLTASIAVASLTGVAQAAPVAHGDRTAPAANPTYSPQMPASGWFRTPVRITWNWSDYQSGIDLEHCVEETFVDEYNMETAHAHCTDQSGNRTTEFVSIKLDMAAPDTQFGSFHPQPTTMDRTATFSFDGINDDDSSHSGERTVSPLAGFECQLDGGGFSACPSPQIYHGLAVGSHTFEVRAADVAGNVDQTPAVYTWTIESNNTLWNGQKLHVEETRISDNGQYTLLMQADSNLVIYGPSGPVWASNTVGANGRFAGMQSDGNLVMYTSELRPVWATGTMSTANVGANLRLENDGRLVLYRTDGATQIWASH